jgi:hypothetical protein
MAATNPIWQVVKAVDILLIQALNTIGQPSDMMPIADPKQFVFLPLSTFRKSTLASAGERSPLPFATGEVRTHVPTTSIPEL